MSSFTKPLRVEAVDESHWKLLEEFDFYLGSLESSEYVSVPEGYVTDFATIPRIFWSIIPPWGKYGKAAVIHDFLCTDGYYFREIDGKRLQVAVTREEADNIFLEAMTVLNVDEVTRSAMYAAVRAYAVITRAE